MKYQVTYRQGDLLFLRLDTEDLPKDATIVADGVMARGEATNHAHRLAPEDLQLNKAKVLSDGPQRLYIEAFETARVLHEEHSPIVLPAGRYEVRRQREYQPDQIRMVAD